MESADTDFYLKDDLIAFHMVKLSIMKNLSKENFSLAVLFFATSYQVSKKELGFRISQGN
jgi:hypothetical protein